MSGEPSRQVGDHIYRVTKPGEEPRWLASCACGETGEPRALGWTGERCAACHDRREEGQPHPEDSRPVTFASGGEGHTLAFSADGALLAVSWGRCHLGLIELSSGEVSSLSQESSDDYREDESWQPLSFSPDGRWLASCFQGFLLLNFWDLHQRDEEPESMTMELGEVLRHQAYSPDGRFFARCNDQGQFEMTLAEGEAFEPEGTVPDHANLFAFRPDGRQLAVASGEGIELYNTKTWKQPRTRRLPGKEDEWLFMQYLPDGGGLGLISGTTWSFEHPRQLYLLPLEGKKKARSATLPASLSRAALSPDGGYLAYAIHEEQASSGEVVFWNLTAWQEAGRLAWNPDDAIRDLTFSSDGAWLATISRTGVVKLWPWRRLLG